MSYLDIALLVLVCVAVWAVVELALTMRGARRSIDEVTTSANEVIEQAQPIVAKLDGMADELEPAIKGVTPIVEKANVTVSSANVSLERVNAILADVSSVSGAASSVTDAVGHAAESAASGVASVVSKLGGSAGKQKPGARLSGSDASASDGHDAARYVDYGDVASATPASDASPDEKNTTTSASADAE